MLVSLVTLRFQWIFPRGLEFLKNAGWNNRDPASRESFSNPVYQAQLEIRLTEDFLR